MENPNVKNVEIPESNGGNTKKVKKSALARMFDERLLTIMFLSFFSMIIANLTITLSNDNWLDTKIWTDFLKAVIFNANILFGGLIAKVMRTFQKKDELLKKEFFEDAINRMRTELAAAKATQGKIASSYFELSRVALASQDPDVVESVKTQGIVMVHEGVDLVNIALEKQNAEAQFIQKRINEEVTKEVAKVVEETSKIIDANIKETIEKINGEGTPE